MYNKVTLRFQNIVCYRLYRLVVIRRANILLCW